MNYEKKSYSFFCYLFNCDTGGLQLKTNNYRPN